MRRRITTCWLGLGSFSWILGCATCGYGDWTVSSPNEQLTVIVTQAESDAAGQQVSPLRYRVVCRGREVLPSASLGITLERLGDFSQEVRVINTTTRVIDEPFTMPVGKRKECLNRANELTINVANRSGATMSLLVRAYDDGLAYCYRLNGTGVDKVLQEDSGFTLPPGTKGWFGRYTQPYYEWYYDAHPQLAGIDYEVAVPALFQTPSAHWALITEAAVYGNYVGARLSLRDAPGLPGRQGVSNQPGTDLRIRLPESPTAPLPWQTPWRVALVGEQLGTLVESTLIANLNPPCELTDIRWIQPGVDVIPWMTGPNTNNSSLARMKQFVDLASDMGWTWIEFDNALALGNQGADEPDKWIALEWIPELVNYANQRGVNVYGWDHWKNLDTPEKRERVLGYFVRHGFKGIKVDFLDSDSQSRFQFREVIARECAERHLMLSFHGETAPRGQQRRWPHIATLEGVKGEEYYLFEYGPTPAYNSTLVFTRNIVGSMDQCPVGFELRGTSLLRRSTTNAHEMALAVVFESGWQSLSVSPESMQHNPASGFLRNLPSAWDDIHFIEGRPDEFAVVARRKGDDWWIAGINAGTPREVLVPWDFLRSGSYDVQLYHDAAEETTWSLELSIENCGGVNAVVSWIELWSTATSSAIEKYDPPRGMPAAPAGYRLIAVDDCGNENQQPDMQRCQNWTYSLSEMPEAVCSQTDPARTMGYHAQSVKCLFANLDPQAHYKLRVAYLSHDDGRAQSMSANGRMLHERLALPKQQLIFREFDVAGTELRQVPVEAVKTKIAVDTMTIDTNVAWKVVLPANGGFGMKIPGSARDMRIP